MKSTDTSVHTMTSHTVWIFNILLLTFQFLQACDAPAGGPDQPVITGADQTSLYFPLLKGKSVGLVSNHTARIGHTHLVDTLISSGIKLKKIFAPEHGFRGNADAGAEIGNTVDRKTGIPLISLYGSRTKPSGEDLKGIGIMIFDIQDVGVRFYTYISTLHYVMEACAENNIPLLVLDRPNPNGHYVDGPLLDTAYRSFVGLHPIPVVYGMTIGELARMINGERWLSERLACDLQVIPCRNYDHTIFYRLPVNPSPNLNSMEAIYLYPSTCFFEGTIMSLGRGTNFPFRVIGHPDYPDRSFSFVPRAMESNLNPLLKGQTCYGKDLRSFTISELQQLKAVKLQWLLDAYRLMNKGGDFFTDYIDKLAGTETLRKQVENGWTEEQIRQSWQADLQNFKRIRGKYLLYKDFAP
jgi:uncharacterized protein YbbC (DUF1343 family)